MNSIANIWVYLSATPLFWLTATLVAFLAGQTLFERAKRHPLANPVAVAIALLIALLALSGTPYQTFFNGAQFIQFLLGPATVALAIPLYQHLAMVRRAILPMLAALLAGSVTAIVSAIVIGKAMGLSKETVMSLAPKSVTSPIAMGISEQIGGLPSLTAALVILTGIFSAITATSFFKMLRITDRQSLGFALGLASHGIGTARAFQIHELAGTFAGIAMALNGIATAILVPLLLQLAG